MVLTTFKDGTVRFDATNSPITQFKPSWIGTSIEKLKELGYTHDIEGKPEITHDSEQTLEIRMQDVIIPYESGKVPCFYLAKYIDIIIEKILWENSRFTMLKILKS